VAYALVGTIGAVSQGAASAAVTAAWGTSENRTANNLLTCSVSGTGIATLPTTPAGWSIGVQRAGTSCSVTVYYKVAAGADAAPTIAAVTSAVWAVQLAEYSGGAASPADQSGGNSATTSPLVATCGAADAGAGDLVIGCQALLNSAARTNATWSPAFNNGATATSNVNNAATSTANHYGFVYGTTTGNAAADTHTLTFTTTSVTGCAVAMASFKLTPVQAGTATLSATAGMTVAGTSPRPYLVAQGPINQGTGTLAPTFGQPTTAGNLLVCLISENANSPIVTNPNGAWVLAGRQAQNYGIIYYRPNCLASESPPTFTDGSCGGQGTAILLEFGNVATSSPLDLTTNTQGSSNPYTLTQGAPSAAPGELLIAVAGASASEASGSLTFNNATAVNIASNTAHVVNYQMVYGIGTTNATADSTTVTYSATPGVYGAVFVSFKGTGPSTIVGAVALHATAGMTAIATTVSGSASFSTLADDFNSGSINSTTWTNGSPSQISVVAGQLQVATVTAAQENQLYTNSFYDLTSSYVSMQLVSAGNTALTSLDMYPVLLQDSGGTNQLYWYQNNGFLAAYQNVAGTSTQVFLVSYNSTNQQWLRIREAAGTTYWEYSADGSTWTVAHSVANPIPVTSLRLIMQAGTFSTATSASTVIFDNVNTTPASGAFVGTATASMSVAASITEVSSVALAGTAGLTVTPTPVFGSLQDNFDTNVIDATKWNASNTTQVTAASQRINIASTTAPAVYYLASTHFYELEGSGVVVQCGVGSQAINSFETYPILIEVDGNNQLYFYVLQGFIAAYTVIGGTQTQVASVAYSATSHAWLQISATPTTVYWWTSPDGHTWTQFASAALNVIFNQPMQFYFQAGTYNTEVSTTSSWIDNVNLQPSAVNLSGSTGMTVGALVTEVASVTLAGGAALNVSALVTEVSSVSMSSTTSLIATSSTAAIDFGTVVLTGTAGMVVSAAVTEVASVLESANAGMTVTGVQVQFGAVALSGTGGLTVAASVTEVASVSMAGSTSLTAAGTRTQLGTVALAGTAGMAVAASVTEVATVALSGTASLAATGTQTQFATVALAGTAGMTVTGTWVQVAAANLSGSSGLTVSASVIEVASVPLSAASGMTVTGTRIVPAAVPLSGTGGLTVSASVVEVAAVNLSGSGAMTVAASVTELAAVSLSGSTGLVVAAGVTELATVAMSGSTVMTVAAGGTQAGQVTLAATAGATVSALVTELATVAMSAHGSLATNASLAITSTVAMAASAAQTTTSLVTQLASVTESGSTTLTVSMGAGLVTATVGLSAAASLTAAGTVIYMPSVVLAGTTSLTATGLRTVLGIVNLAGVASVTVAATAASFALVGLAGATSLTVSISGTETASVLMTAASALTPVGTMTRWGALAWAASASMVVTAGPVQIVAQVTMSSLASMVVAGFLPQTVQGQVQMGATAHLVAAAGEQEIANVTMLVNAVLLASGFLPQTIQGQVAMAALTNLVATGLINPVIFLHMSASTSLTTTAHVLEVSQSVLTARASMTVYATTAAPVRVDMYANTAMTVTAVVETPAGVPEMPSLEDQIIGVAGEDPILMGASGYLNELFTSRLLSDSE
jgi:hypothetical protein